MTRTFATLFSGGELAGVGVQSQGMFGEFEPLPSWIGWYAAIEDLIPTLPESKFAQWQLDRLPAELTNAFLMPLNGENSGPAGQAPQGPTVTANHSAEKSRAFLLSDQSGAAGEGLQIVRTDEPATTVRAGGSGAAAPKAFLIDAVARTDADMTARPDDEPAHTIKSTAFRRPINEPKAFIVEGSASGADNKFDLPVRPEAVPVFTIHGSQPQRAWLSKGRVVSMTPRALARFQSVPDTYDLPANKKLACTVIGNAVPPLLMQRIAESLV